MTTIRVPPGEGGHSRMIHGEHVARAVAQYPAGSFEVVAPAVAMAPPHVSPSSGVLHLIKGQVRTFVGDTSYDVQPGKVVVFPAGAASTFEAVITVPVVPPVEDSRGTILSVTQRHGVSLVGA